MRSRVASLAALAALALGGLAACGEKKENLELVPENEAGLQEALPVPKASQVQISLAAAEELARQTATAKADPDFKIAAAAWQITCRQRPGNVIVCPMSSGPCEGSVFITPTKVPAGESAEGYVPRGDGSRIRCQAPVKKKNKKR